MVLLRSIAVFCLMSLPAAAQTPAAPPPTSAPPPTRTPVRTTMEALHQSGGVPAGWRLSVPAGDARQGREVFVQYECHSCHVVRGETFPRTEPDANRVGPELTGMGGHHPPEYFAEAILNPDAILIEGQGYLSESGHSKMPTHEDMSLRQLADLVAYLVSLRGPEPACAMHSAPAVGVPSAGSSRGPNPVDGLSYFAQAYEVEDARLDDFYAWFDRGEFRKVPGLLRIDTYASRLRDGRHTILCLFGLQNDAALTQFLASRQAIKTPGSFVRPVAKSQLETPPLYRAIQMTIE